MEALMVILALVSIASLAFCVKISDDLRHDKSERVKINLELGETEERMKRTTTALIEANNNQVQLVSSIDARLMDLEQRFNFLASNEKVLKKW